MTAQSWPEHVAALGRTGAVTAQSWPEHVAALGRTPFSGKTGDVYVLTRAWWRWPAGTRVRVVGANASAIGVRRLDNGRNGVLPGRAFGSAFRRVAR